MKGYWARTLIAEFPNRTWTLSGWKIEATGSAQRRQGSGRKCMMITIENYGCCSYHYYHYFYHYEAFCVTGPSV